MGYYSTMSLKNFKTPLSQEELEERFRKFLQQVPECDRPYLEMYTLEVGPDHTVEMVPEDGEYYAKHYASDALAEFISGVIAPDDHAVLEFVGEDGERWAYLITKGHIEEIFYVPCVQRNGRLVFLEKAVRGREEEANFVRQLQQLRSRIERSLEESLQRLSDLPDGVYSTKVAFSENDQLEYGVEVRGGEACFVLCEGTDVWFGTDVNDIPLEDAALLAEEMPKFEEELRK